MGEVGLEYSRWTRARGTQSVAPWLFLSSLRHVPVEPLGTDIPPIKSSQSLHAVGREAIRRSTQARGEVSGQDELQSLLVQAWLIMECSAARDGVIPRNYLHRLGLLRRVIYLITKVTPKHYSTALY